MSLSPSLNDPTVIDPNQSISSTFQTEQRGTINSSVHQLFTIGSVLYLITLAIPLLFFPRILSLIFGSLLTASGEIAAVNVGNQVAGSDVINNSAPEIIRQLNVLERTLASFTGLSLLSLASMLLVQSGLLPLTSSLSASNTKLEEENAPFRTPSVIVTTLFFTATAYYAYDLGLWLITLFSGAFSTLGFWAILFATTSRVNSIGGNSLFKTDQVEARKVELKKEL